MARKESTLNRCRSKDSGEKDRPTKFPMKKELGIIIQVPWKFRTEAKAIPKKLQLKIKSQSQRSQRKPLSKSHFWTRSPPLGQRQQLPKSLGFPFQGEEKRKMTGHIAKDNGKHSGQSAQRIGSNKSYQRNFPESGKRHQGQGSQKRDQGRGPGTSFQLSCCQQRETQRNKFRSNETQAGKDFHKK